MLYQHVHSAGFYYDWYKGDLMFQVICHDGLGRVVRHDLHSIIIDGVPFILAPGCRHPRSNLNAGARCSAEHRPARGITHLQQIFESKGNHAMTVESLKAADALLALAGLMNDQKMLKELRVTRDEANATITKLFSRLLASYFGRTSTAQKVEGICLRRPRGPFGSREPPR
jgi:hypothetical protein